MINSKNNAAILVKELNKIMTRLGSMKSCLIEELTEAEDCALTEVLLRQVSNIMYDIEVPLVREYPCLRHRDLLEENQKVTYQIIKYNKEDGSSEVIKTGIIPERSEEELIKIESSESNENYIFWLELE